MRFSEAWLREYVNPELDTSRLVHQLTMAGMEVDSVEPVAGVFEGVVIGEILETTPHPKADRLRVCRVAAGLTEPLQIVCGAPNARPGLKAPLALEGARLPGDLHIRPTRLRDVESFGMLCSARELGLEEDQGGLWELPSDAPTGMDIRQYLTLDDQIIEVDLTPNRADCLSILGIAREVALLNELECKPVTAEAVGVSIPDTLPVRVQAPEACPRYLGRLIRGVPADAVTPLWMRERLRRSGVRTLGLVVDVTNYVLLELGQPLHAFDAGHLEGGITVRRAHTGEMLALLNGETATLHDDTLVIADDRKALALAGIMGGSESAVTATTTDIFLECAFFTPSDLMGKARRHGLTTDSSHRFERGVDPDIQVLALNRATSLIQHLGGGQAGPVIEVTESRYLPVRNPVSLRADRIRRLLGLELDASIVADILTRLGMKTESTDSGWSVTPPSFRFDVSIEADLIEEIGRVYGYDRLPRRALSLNADMRPASETRLDANRLKDVLVDRGYQEAITYSFVDPAWQTLIDPEQPPLPLKNPISQDLAVMRTSLWVGLLGAALNNVNRQQSRVRFFESGLRFLQDDQILNQTPALAGLALGTALPEQWGEVARPVDFFDLKADVDALLALTGHTEQCDYVAGRHPALHPGQTAEIKTGHTRIGWLGMLHPAVGKRLGFEQNVYLFELCLESLLARTLPRFHSLSRFPSVRRDIAILVDDTITAGAIRLCVGAIRHSILRQVSLFDVYQGQGVAPGKKSLALACLFQDEQETLTDARVDEALAEVLARLQQECGAELRQ
ncbi:MAG: phenylalanine--tRNA ligase subunit beta [Methylococcaceae bacterium]